MGAEKEANTIVKKWCIIVKSGILLNSCRNISGRLLDICIGA